MLRWLFLVLCLLAANSAYADTKYGDWRFVIPLHSMQQHGVRWYVREKMAWNHINYRSQVRIALSSDAKIILKKFQGGFRTQCAGHIWDALVGISEPLQPGQSVVVDVWVCNSNKGGIKGTPVFDTYDYYIYNFVTEPID